MEWVLSGLRARHEASARRTAVAMCLVAAVVTLGSGLTVPPAGRVAQVLALGASPALAGLAVALYLPYPRVRTAALTASPFLALFVVLGLDLITDDASAAAQVSFCLPVLVAAYHFRSVSAVLVSLLAVFGDAYLVFTVKPGATGTLDVVYMTMTLGLMTGLLVTSGLHQDRLVALLKEQANVDALTGLVSRRVLDDASRRALERTVAPGTALLVADIDHFKGINDTYGHLIGDDALIHVGALLGPVSFEGPVSFDGEAVVARMGGDELAALLPGCSCEDAVAAAEALVRRVRAAPLQRTDGAPVPLTVSVGVGHTVVPVTLRELYGAADTSLYGAKRGGRDGVGAPVTLPPSPMMDLPGQRGEIEVGDLDDDRLDRR